MQNNTNNTGLKDNIRQNDQLTFARLALALANDYQSVYYLNSEDDSYVEYGASGDEKELMVLSHGKDFFSDTVYNCRRMVYPEDQERFLETFRKENLLDAVKNDRSFTLNYRLMINGVPCYYNLKTIRGTGPDDKYIIIGVRNVDDEVRREKEAARRSETYSQIAKALASRYEVVYYINLRDNSFIEYASQERYAKIGVRNQGDDFFEACQKEIKKSIYPEDCARLMSELRRDKFIETLEISGSLNITYRQILDGRPQYVSLIAVRPKNDPDHAVLGVLNIDAAKRRELSFREALSNAIDLATHDALTSVRNKHAYDNFQKEMDMKIAEKQAHGFAVAIFDINGLKDINDSFGHIAGDEYIRSACYLICHTFKHSSVFRIGGDEFAVVMNGEDYEKCDELMKNIESHVRENSERGLVTISGGVSKYDPGADSCTKDVFSRADTIMYNNKKKYKEYKNGDKK